MSLPSEIYYHPVNHPVNKIGQLENGAVPLGVYADQVLYKKLAFICGRISLPIQARAGGGETVQ